MRKPKQITLEQRYQIYISCKAGHNQTQIARNLGVHKSTISRELHRNLGNAVTVPSKHRKQHELLANVFSESSSKP